MKYVSTRGEAPVLDFEGVVLAGLAEDGGLYLPVEWPTLSADTLRSFRGRTYVDVAVEVMAPFVAPSITRDELRTLCEGAYGGFAHAEVTPVVRLGEMHLLELFHGPTLAFKDVALQLLGRMFDHLLTRRGERATVVGATSGDTGSAAIEGCRGRDALDIFILHPHGRTSEVQRRQMTTVADANVFNLAVEGTFDDCQDIVKAMFRDPQWRGPLNLTAVNSINWARVMAQIVYYVTASVALGAPDRELDFTVPTGNFGDVFAGWCARRMGVPVGRLIVATNTNDILARALETGSYRVDGVVPTLSPSMDIQLSSNFERLLFEASGRDAAAVRSWMAALRSDGGFELPAPVLDSMREVFGAHRVDDEGTLAVIGRVARELGQVVDPHTAVGIGAAEAVGARPGVPMVVLATAHAAKFPDAVETATGERPRLPEHLADLLDREERYDVVPADLQTVADYVAARSRVSGSLR